MLYLQSETMHDIDRWMSIRRVNQLQPATAAVRRQLCDRIHETPQNSSTAQHGAPQFDWLLTVKARWLAEAERRCGQNLAGEFASH